MRQILQIMCIHVCAQGWDRVLGGGWSANRIKNELKLYKI